MDPVREINLHGSTYNTVDPRTQKRAFTEIKNILYGLFAEIATGVDLCDKFGLRTADVMPGGVVMKVSLFNLLESSGQFSEKNVSATLNVLEDLLAAHPGAITPANMNKFKEYQRLYCAPVATKPAAHFAPREISVQERSVEQVLDVFQQRHNIHAPMQIKAIPMSSAPYAPPAVRAVEVKSPEDQKREFAVLQDRLHAIIAGPCGHSLFTFLDIDDYLVYQQKATVLKELEDKNIFTFNNIAKVLEALKALNEVSPYTPPVGQETIELFQKYHDTYCKPARLNEVARAAVPPANSYNLLESDKKNIQLAIDSIEKYQKERHQPPANRLISPWQEFKAILGGCMTKEIVGIVGKAVNSPHEPLILPAQLDSIENGMSPGHDLLDHLCNRTYLKDTDESLNKFKNLLKGILGEKNNNDERALPPLGPVGLANLEAPQKAPNSSPPSFGDIKTYICDNLIDGSWRLMARLCKPELVPHAVRANFKTCREFLNHLERVKVISPDDISSLRDLLCDPNIGQAAVWNKVEIMFIEYRNSQAQNEPVFHAAPKAADPHVLRNIPPLPSQEPPRVIFHAGLPPEMDIIMADVKKPDVEMKSPPAAQAVKKGSFNERLQNAKFDFDSLDDEDNEVYADCIKIGYVIDEPVTVGEHTFDKSSLKGWIDKCLKENLPVTNPKTGQILQYDPRRPFEDQFPRNLAMVTLLEQFVKKQEKKAPA